MPTSPSIRFVRLLLIIFFALSSFYFMSRSYSRLPIPPSADSFTPGGKEPSTPPPQFPVNEHPPQPPLANPPDEKPDEKAQLGSMKAAFVTLIRNAELWEIVKSIRQVEDRFNKNYHYPWVFLNDVPFTDEFIEVTSALVSGKAKYGIHNLQGANANCRFGA